VIEVRKEGVILQPTRREFENQAVLNPACIKTGQNVKMFYRAVREGNYSSIGYCKLEGPLEVVERYEAPILYPEHDYESHGCEDPRIVELDGTYYLFYTAYDGKNAVSAYASSKNLVKWKKHGVITPKVSYDEAEDIFRNSRQRLKEKYFFFEAYYKDVVGDDVLLWEKDVFIFPKRINGKLALVHRILPDIQVAYVKEFSDLTPKYWREYLHHLSDHILLSSKYWYESRNIGGGPTPIETSEGWLLIYHAVEDADEGKVYHASAALLDRDNPQKVIGHLKDPLFSPSMEWERHGDVDNVVFPTGLSVFDGRLYIYYGAADKRVAAASMELNELLDELLDSEGYEHILSEIGHTAGEILESAAERPVKCSELMGRLDKDDKVILMAMGWLAKEGKIDFMESKKDFKIRTRR
jgi:predicted GH43/DUF377 family glycosyl hydrolase